LAFLLEFHADLFRYKKMQIHCIPYKKTSTFSPPFCAPLAQRAQILTSENYVRPTYAVKFCPDPLRIVGVIPEKLIL